MSDQPAEQRDDRPIEHPSEPPYAGPDDPRVAALPPEEFAFPGPLRDQLVAAVLSGAKTSTTGLVADYEHEGEPLPRPGNRGAVLDSDGRRVAVIETTDVRVVPLADVDLRHALDEGEGYESVAAWRATHEGFWRSPEMLAALDDPAFTVDDATPVVLQRFRLVADLR
ncbi:ASCH domain-containing protein [Kitasatospora sp. NPDC056446]|uniref:ASCH domain-containing protein n=1 Tax=Kitasatospora sp. NPDC056446 TaxID=3345819 RepID=UPI00369B9B32